jgi:hypothetical protein
MTVTCNDDDSRTIPTQGGVMNKRLLQAVVSALEDTQSIRKGISAINAEALPAAARVLLRSVFGRCDALDSILEEALARSCHMSISVLATEEETDDREIALSGNVR